MNVFARLLRQHVAPERVEPEIGEPGVASRRQLRRLTSAVARGYDAAGTDRLTSTWGATPIPVDTIVRQQQRALVARARDQAQNNDYGKKYLRLVRRNVVGPDGILLQARARDVDGTLDERANDAIEAAWADWGRKVHCTVTGRMSWRQVQIACITSAARDGEFFLRLVMGSEAGDYGLQLQLIDAQRCPVDMDEDRRDGTFIRSGIEFSRYGRAIAYYFTTLDEAEQDYFYGGRWHVRIPAEEIIHGYEEEMSGQKRGLPWMSTGLLRLKHLAEYEKATVVNARIGASKMGFFEWEEGYGPEADEDDEVTMDVEPGVFRELPSGVRVKEFAPQFPHGEYQMFQKSQLRGVASGLDVSYNTLANDVSEVNFSSIRQSLLDERDGWRDLQSWLIETLCTPVFEAWLPRALLLGRIRIGANSLRPAMLDKYRAHAWQPRRWQWVDPRADVEAAIKGKNNLLSSPSSIIREQGRDPDSVWREVAADIAAMKAAGIPDEFIRAAINDQMGKQYTEGSGSNGKDDT